VADRRPVAQAGIRHPLMGARLRTLAAAVAANGLPAPRALPLAALMGLSALARAPFGLVDALRMAGAGGAAMAAPVFIVGHWRTGTTHLHNLMSRSPEFGQITPLASGLPDQILSLGTWLRPLLERALPEDRHVDRVAVDPDSPQEDEIPLANLQPLSVFQAVYFPRHFQRQVDRGVFFDGATPREIARWQRRARRFAEKIWLHQGRRTLLIKNPVYTARIRRLREIWPDARFVHIRRNPYVVFASTRHYYSRLLPDLALQRYEHIALDAFVLDTFTRVMARYREESAAVPPSQLVEVVYEDLDAAPIPTLARIFERLGLAGWDETRPRVEAYLERIRDYRKNAYSLSPEDIAKVEDAWGGYIRRWGYAPPREAA
jgi:hypothetical protein